MDRGFAARMTSMLVGCAPCPGGARTGAVAAVWCVSALLVATLLLGVLVVVHQLPFLAHLTLRQLVLLLRMGLATPLALTPYGRTGQLHPLAIDVLHITGIGARY